MNKVLFDIVISCMGVAFILAATACNTPAVVVEPNKQSESVKTVSSENEEVSKPVTELDRFLRGIDMEIADSFDISLDDYTKAEIKSLISKQNEIYYHSLLSVQSRVISKQNRGDYMPSIYLSKDGKSGYILEKKADGTNCLYEMVYENEWKTVKSDKKPGKQMASNTENIGQQTKYKPLSVEQINSFASGKNISVLAFKNFANASIILYETDNEMGTYQLSCDDTGRVLEMGNCYGNNNSNITPVSIGTEGDFDKSLAHVIINDKDMLNKASTIKVLFEDENDIIEYVNKNKGHILLFPDSKSRATNILVCGQDGSILFNQKITNFDN